MHALAATGTAAEAGHVRFRAALVEEDESVGIKADLAPPPSSPGFDDVVPVLLASSERLFLYVSPMLAST